MRKVLIANRGEIACRIARSCREAGLATVAVHSQADAGALHVASADEAYDVGPPPAAQSYLDSGKILAVARASGADAIHPGYGFLSENADFAQAVIDAGLIWIGPAPESIRAMGDKQRAREVAQAAGVPIVPGTPRLAVGDDPSAMVEAAAAIGFPLLVKASAGGGGIGMRRVDDPAKLAETIATVQNAALKSFGDGTVYCERFVPRARHVEVQVFGFGDGRALHLHERDCSLQRRFQKIIEETPAPRLPDDVRARMCDAAVALTRHARYAGAGTVEFIVDAQSFAFYFLEMNTRIQVEHPVTEMVTGLDLVRMQLDLAAGRPPALTQADIRPRGAAIECRLYAENPQKNFFPSPGTLAAFVLPPASERLRIDTGFREGDAITPYYDPMIAKIIAWGETREAAIAEAAAALAATQVEGPKTNLAFLRACLADADFAAGDVFTGFVDEHKARLVG